MGGTGFVNAPLTASEVREFKMEIKSLVEDLVGITNQVDQFLSPSIYMWEELNSILSILVTPEEVQLIQAAGMRAWERENRQGPPGEIKMPANPPNWESNDEIGRRNMKDYRTLVIKGIKESVPRVNNAKLAFEASQD